ncbi:transglycosylase family protein [Streptomyces sp. NPDC086091]|uniref:transglycosylase family protein n=1 Tax=Streptomyces sp. NPDC086091 TaxID=3365751 RepID=UPI0037F7A83F
MLSGNGRHRRPRQAPALLVAAGVTGSAIAIPLLGASGASAADGSVWDKVAECETGGSWSADEGGGEYGGLALSQDDWVAYGGLDYAERADLASRNQQISIAQKLLADQGVGAWGSCAPEAGLTLANGTGALDTGVVDDSGENGSSGASEDSSLVPGLSDLSKDGTGSSGSSGSSGSGKSADPSAESGDPSANPSADEKTSPSSSPSSSSSAKPAPSGSPDADDPTASGTPSDDTDTPDRSGEFVQDVGSWSLVDTGSLGSAPTLDGGVLGTGSADADADADSGTGRHRGATAEEKAVPDATEPASSGRHAANATGAPSGTYTVRVGDSLESIADSLDLDGGWRALYAANRGAIGADPDNISAGQTLTTPVGTEAGNGTK